MDEDNGLTLQRLAHRLEALERENERMSSENAELRDEVASLSGSKKGQAVESAFEGRVSRREETACTARPLAATADSLRAARLR